MDPAEEIVNSYFHSQGYFTMTNIKVGLNEIDILAMNPRTRRRVHAEVHISLKPTGKIRPWGPLKFQSRPQDWRVAAICNHKFIGSAHKMSGKPRNRRIQEMVRTLLGSDKYDRWYVIGRVNPKDSLSDLRQSFKQNGVTLVLFQDLLSQLDTSLGRAVHMDDARRYLELCRAFLDARDSRRLEHEA